MGAADGREASLACHECGEAVTAPIAYACHRCGGPLVLVTPPASPSQLRAEPHAQGIWRYRRALPATDAAICLGEGATPVVALGEQVAGQPGLLAKLEQLNPTLSFKDRAMALGASVALDLGAAGLVLASTGNAAVSAAAYASAASLPCTIYCAASTSGSDKLELSRALGAHVVAVDGDYSTAHARAVGMEDQGWLNVTTTYRNPYLTEGHRTVAYELVDALGDRRIDAVVVPVGAGPLLRGIANGFADLLAVDAIEAAPRMIGVQGQGCSPLAHAWDQGPRESWLASLESWGPAAPTLAGAIADPLRGYEREGLLTLASVAGTGGDLVAVADAEIRKAARALGRGGYLVEATAAATLAAVPRLAERGAIEPGDTVVLVLTGHGMKERAILDEMRAEARAPEEAGST